VPSHTLWVDISTDHSIEEENLIICVVEYVMVFGFSYKPEFLGLEVMNLKVKRGALVCGAESKYRETFFCKLTKSILNLLQGD